MKKQSTIAELGEHALVALLLIVFFLLAFMAPAVAQRPLGRPQAPDGTPYGIVLEQAACIDWFGEPLLLMWSAPTRPGVVRLDDMQFIPRISVGLEVVAFAVYDPRPCAQFHTASFTSDEVLQNLPIFCEQRTWSAFVKDDWGYHFPTEKTLLQSCAPYGSSGDKWTNYLAHYPWPYPCGGSPFPPLAFILARPVLL